MDGGTASISAEVKNTGNASGNYVAVLILNGEEIARQHVTLAPSSSTVLYMHLSDLSAGAHQIGIGDSVSSLQVHSWVPYTIKYCKGQSEWFLFAPAQAAFRSSGDTGQIVRFTPPTTPFRIRKINICGEARTANPNDLDARQFTVRIWNQDGTLQLWSAEFPWRIFEKAMSWREVTVPNVRVEEDFYVEVVTHSDAGAQAKNYLDIAFELARDALPIPRRFEYYRLSAFESRSGWSWNGRLIDPPEGSKTSINWYISVDGEGPDNSPPNTRR
jgi:hypothetical protein